MEAEILREVPEIDAVLTHIESEPATIEQPEEMVEEDRRIEQAMRAAAGCFRRLWMCMRSRWAAPASTSQLSCHCTLPDDLTMQRVHVVDHRRSKTASSWSARRSTA